MTAVAMHLTPSNTDASWVAFSSECPACGGRLAPLSVSQSSGIVAWLPVKCSEVGCRREWAIKAQIVGVTDQAQSRYVGGAA